MIRKAIKTLLVALLGIIAMTSPIAGLTASLSAPITFTGVLTAPQPPATCSIISTPTFNFNVQSGPTKYTSNTNDAVLNCSSGLAYQVSSDTAWRVLDIGEKGGRIGIALLNPSNGDANLANNPISVTGTGASQNIGLRMRLGGQAPDSNLNPGTDNGAFSGAINLLLLY